MRNALIALGVLMGATLTLHVAPLGGYFLVDDWVNLRWFEEPSQIWGVFTGNWMFGERHDPTGALYRPIPRLSFLLDRAIWGLRNPGGIHLTNKLLHGLNVFFMWGICWTLWRRRSLAYLGALLFLGHRLTVEPAVWISGRTDLWVAVFSFPAIWITIALSGERFSKHRFWTLLLMQLAFCSKETAAVLPALLLLIDLLLQRGWTKARIAWWAATLLLWALYFLQRRWMFGEFVGYGMGERYASPGAYARNAFLAAKLIVAPTSSTLLRWVLYVLWVLWAMTAVWRTASRQTPWPPFLIPVAWFALAMAPLATLGFSLTDNTRLLYPATAALCVLAAGAVGELASVCRATKQARIIVAVVIPTIFFLLTAAGAGVVHWASMCARLTVESIVDDFTANPPTGTVIIETPPERLGGVSMFRTIDLPLAVSMILDERGISHPPILGRVQWDNIPEAERPEPVMTLIDYRPTPESDSIVGSWIVRHDTEPPSVRILGALEHD